MSELAVDQIAVDRELGGVQAVKDDCDLLAVLCGEDVVEQRGFAGAEIA